MSRIVGITVLPARLTRVAPAGTVTLPAGPTAAMRPAVTTIVAFSIGALPSPTITRAASKAVVPAGAWACGSAAPVSHGEEQSGEDGRDAGARNRVHAGLHSGRQA